MVSFLMLQPNYFYPTAQLPLRFSKGKKRVTRVVLSRKYFLSAAYGILDRQTEAKSELLCTVKALQRNDIM